MPKDRKVEANEEIRNEIKKLLFFDISTKRREYMYKFDI
jgi:hypothetical protein